MKRMHYLAGLLLSALLLVACGSSAESPRVDAAAPDPIPEVQTAEGLIAAPVMVAETWLWVGSTGGSGAYLRGSMNLADRVKAWPEGTRVAVIGERITAEGIEWVPVRAPDGAEGFFPSSYLVEEEPAPISWGQTDQPTVRRPDTATPEASWAPLLQLLPGGGCSVTGQFASYEGHVKNISNQTLRNVTAEVSYFNAFGVLMAWGQSLIDSNPLQPGSTSSFKIATMLNPGMARCTVRFTDSMTGAVLQLY